MANFRAHPHNPTGSQESLASYMSGAAIAESSNASQTTADTDLTRPLSPGMAARTAPYASTEMASERSRTKHSSETHPAANDNRLRTPENNTNASGGQNDIADLQSHSTPAAGHKRMASGQIKSREDIVYTTPVSASQPRAARNDSIGSAGSKASEVAGALKERLTYAMAKVHHGWEHHNIDQVERLAAAAVVSPRTIVSPRRVSRTTLTSPSSALMPARILTDQMPQHGEGSCYEGLRSAPRMRSRGDAGRASSDESMSPPTRRRTTHDTLVSPTARTGLGMAVDLPIPVSPYRRHARNGSQNQSIPSSPARRTPTTPKANRPPTIRTQTQTAAAEQEAMDALLLMGSPSHGAFPRSSQQSSATQSPTRRNFQTSVPRQALQYRSESTDSIVSESSIEPRDPDRMADIMRQRGAMLDQVEAES